MFELIVRVVLASGAMVAAGVLGRPDFELAWKSALLFAAYSYLLYMMEQKGARNPGVAGLAAVADCGVLAVIIGDLGLLEHFGALSALPMLYAFARFKSNAAMMAPLVASWLLVGANLFSGGNAFTPNLLVQALGVLLLGVVLSQVRAYRENRAPKPPPKLEEALRLLQQTTPEKPDQETVDPEEYRAFRESFRELSDGARELERRGRRDRACVQLYETAVRQPRSPFAAVASKIHDLSGAEGVAVYTCSQDGLALVLRGTSGSLDSTLGETAIELPRQANDGEIESLVLAAIAEQGTKAKTAALALRARNRPVGAIALSHSNNIELEASVRQARETTDFVAELTSDIVGRENDQRRMREAELLYSVATTAIGATTQASLAARVARDLYEAVRLDHLSVWTVSDGAASRIALEGVDHRIHEDVAYANGQGTHGWLREGAPVVSIDNARTDKSVTTADAVRLRIGSVLIVPLEYGPQPFGFVVATTNKPNGIGPGETETVRAVCAELSQALARMSHVATGPEGLATPKEFFDVVRSAGGGHLVYLEVPQREELTETYGRPAMEHAVRRFAVRLKSELPAAAAMTRRNEGDYVAFIPSNDEQFVRRWANDATALASLTGVRTPDGKTRIPLALRAKVAPMNPQIHRISNERHTYGQT